MSAQESNVAYLRDLVERPATAELRRYVVEASDDEGDIILPFSVAQALLDEVES